jgi:hypothetical protein
MFRTTKSTSVLALLLAVSVAFVACKRDPDDDPDDVKLVGIQGEWQSSGTDVAPLLVTLFKTDSIYAKFNTDNTYLVEQYDNLGAKVTLSGTYTQANSGTNDIWTITVNQSSPAPLVSSGILKVWTASPDSMWYEIAQTSPDIGAVPATPAGGFGSTNAGAFGSLNVQKYRRIVK